MEIEDVGLFDDIRAVLGTALKIDPETVTREAEMGNLPGWDSMGHMEVLVNLEEKFGVEISAYTITELVSITSIYKHIKGEK